jgi:2'-5' RNA ligase
MNRYVIVLLLPKYIEDVINSVRDHFEPGVSLKIPPHLSISYPFFSDKKEILANRITTCLPSVEIPRISLTGLGIFQKEGQGEIVYAKVHPEEPFKKIYEILNMNVLQDVNIDTSTLGGKIPMYVPHITLSMKSGVVNDQWLKSKLAQLFNRTFPLEKIALFENTRGDTNWTLEQSFPLKKPF